MKKTFTDLEFKPHGCGNGLQALSFFPNGYGISVVRFKIPYGGYGSYTSDETEWELAVLKGNKESWQLTYDTPITNDVLGYLSNDEVTETMSQVQDLPLIPELQEMKDESELNSLENQSTEQ